MWLTASKNLGKNEIQIAKRLAKYLPNFKFISRSRRNLERICFLAQKKGEDEILVFVKEVGGERKLRKYLLDMKNGKWNWDEDALLILNCEFLADGKNENEEMKIIAEGENEKEIAKYLGFDISENEETEDDEEIQTIQIKANRLKIIVGEKEILRMELEWDKL